MTNSTDLWDEAMSTDVVDNRMDRSSTAEGLAPADELQAPETKTLYRVKTESGWYCFQTFGEAAGYAVQKQALVEVLCDDGWYAWNDSAHVCPICKLPGGIHEACKEQEYQDWKAARSDIEDLRAGLHW